MAIVIIGANSAVAKAFVMAELERNLGEKFLFVVRQRPSLEPFIEQIQSLTQSNPVAGICELAYADFADSDKRTEAWHRLKTSMEAVQSSTGKDIHQVLLAYGFLPSQALTEQDTDLAQQVIDVNGVSSMLLLNEMVPFLADQNKPCKVGVITSVAGMRGRPRNFTYGAAKAALSVYLQGLRSVYYADANMHFYDFRLGPVDTPMTIDHEKNFSFSTPDHVAKLLQAAFKTQRLTHYIPGFWRWVMWVVVRLPEPLFQRLRFLSAR